MNRGRHRGRTWAGWFGISGALLLLVTLATLPPFLPEEGRAVLMRAFAPVCHQMPERSLHMMGVPLAVGHRCYGIYWGLLGGAFLFLGLQHRWGGWLHQQAPYVLGAAALPAAGDWLLGMTGIWSNTPASRMLTGALFGVAAGYYLVQAVVGSIARKRAPAAP